MAIKRSSEVGELLPRTGDEIRQAFLKFYAERGHQIIPSASLIPQDPTVLLTIAGMLPFKPVFLGQMERPAPRATSSQKCIRTNDIDNVGRTARHHTFFEMLGNFSFGDYFKKEAIQWAWELSTNIFGLNSDNLVISVFREDEETELIWRDFIGVHPQRIIRMNEADNFWSSGPTGPCGPCSELYYDFNPSLGNESIDLEDDTRFIEFYNLVFMQYNRDAQGTLTPLANCNIDTGMGLERMAQILQGVSNNYETDLIYPLLQKAALLGGIDYQKVDKKMQTSLKVIGDHSRAITQLISDGVTASNLGRGYILRRLLRRVVRHGRLIGIKTPFLMDMGEACIELMKVAFPQLIDRREVILQELQREEARFLETLERGERLLSDILASNPKKISGELAFELYDTYGFPLELTEEIALEHDLAVDLKGFEEAMQVQRQRAKAASLSIDLTLQKEIDKVVGKLEATQFQGYDFLEHNSSVQALVVNGQSAEKALTGDIVQIVLDTTPFYGEGGGQVGDRGVMISAPSDADACVVQIDAVTRNQNVFVHSGYVERGGLSLGGLVQSQVNVVCRQRAQAHHTATHLLQSALKQVVDPDIGQAGSLVNFERLRFDFHSPHPVNLSDLEKVERLVNSWIAEAHPITTKDMKIQDAKSSGAVAMFGEKYGDVVRVVDVPGVSKELCGGTHVRNTSEIGVFKIVSETGIASGIRRIEAVAGPAVLDYLNEREVVVRNLSDRFKVQPSEIVERVIGLQDELKLTGKALLLAREELAIAKVAVMATRAIHIGSSQVLVERIDGVDASSLQSAAQGLVDKLGQNTAVVLGGVPDFTDANKVTLVAAFGSEIVSCGIQAGKFIGSVAKICGGGGGGRPTLAQAGGRDAKALDDALSFALEKLDSTLS